MLQLIKDNEFTRIYRITNGELITMVIDEEDFSYINFFNNNKEEIGIFEFSPLNEFSSDFKLKYMYLDTVNPKYKRQGLGESALKFFKEITDANIYTSPNDGQQRDDGSHLTGDAIYFVSKMKQKGIISGDYPSIHEDELNNGFIDL